MISSELLSRILPNTSDKSYRIGPDNSGVFVVIVTDHAQHGLRSYLNIYELAHLCKQWCISIGFEVTTVVSEFYVTCAIVDKDNNYEPNPLFNGANEQEAVFAATQWIYEQSQLKDNT